MRKFRKSLIALSALFFLTSGIVRSDEGMWVLSLINKNYEDMKRQGFKLTPEDIYNINKSSLKDAICGLGMAQYPLNFFCSAEIVSEQGLVFTNHHCAYEAIQTHSTVEHDYLSNGFWAQSFDMELPVEGSCASFLVRIEDVTERVLKDVNEEMAVDQRETLVEKAIKEIEKEARKGSNYLVSVYEMFKGNQYFLYVYEVFNDVRLVGAPPSSIGKFGGDTDNWMWPRHTGDFSVLRVYMSPDGKPAKYSKDNVPMKPKHSLPVSLKGIEKGDFSMVLGFPGVTNRYQSSFGVREQLEVLNPAAIKIRTKKLELMKEDMDASDKVRIQYASKYAQTANYWKYFIGQSKGLKRLDIIGQKQQIEKQFTEWYEASADRKKLYGNILATIQNSYETNRQKSLAFQYLLEALFQGSEIILYPLKLSQFYQMLKAGQADSKFMASMTEQAKQDAMDFFKDFNLTTDKKIFAELVKMYHNDLPAEYHLEINAQILKKYKGDYNRFAGDVYKNSIFADEKKMMSFLDNPSAKTIENDMAFKISQQVLKIYLGLANIETAEANNAKRLFEKGLIEMNPGKFFYPDANSSLRITYGNVGDYKPADAIYYNYYTTLSGIIEKEDAANEEFTVPLKLKELYKNKDFSRYSRPDGTLPVCFISNNDITGGNSGSAVLNGSGELIGIAFDGNWEAMSGDIAYEPNLQKCINVDIRYVLFIIDKFAGAQNLIKELNVVN